MSKYTKVRSDILIQCHLNNMKMIKFNYIMLEINIILGVLRGVFGGFGCPKRHSDTLLAKTMPETDKMKYNTYIAFCNEVSLTQI